MGFVKGRSVSLVFLAVVLLSAVHAQGVPGASNRAQLSGAIASVDAPANRLAMKTDKGDAVNVSLTDKTVIIRIPAGETDVKKGNRIAVTDLAPGDRIVAIGRQSDPNSLEARSVLVMSQADVAQVRQKEHAEWQRRGITGTVTAIDPGAKTFALKTGQHTVTVTPTDSAEYRRYSPDSAKYVDSKPSSFSGIRMGDQARVLGNRTEDQTGITAEKIVFGTFRQIAATITSIDPQTGDVSVKDLATKNSLIVRVNSDTTLRKLPDTMARMLARRYQAGTAAAPGGVKPSEGEANRAAHVPGRAGNGSGDIGAMLDRLPPIQLADLKPGDAIMVSTTSGKEPGRVTATTLLAGVEPLLTASPSATRDIMSGWNLGSGGDADNQQ